MRENFNLNKRRREEAKKKKHEEKMAKRLQQKTQSQNPESAPAPEATPDA